MAPESRREIVIVFDGGVEVARELVDQELALRATKSVNGSKDIMGAIVEESIKQGTGIDISMAMKVKNLFQDYLQNRINGGRFVWEMLKMGTKEIVSLCCLISVNTAIYFNPVATFAGAVIARILAKRIAKFQQKKRLTYYMN